MRARSAIRVELDRTGAARITELRSEVPVVLRPTGGRARAAGAAAPGPEAAAPEIGALFGALPTVVVHLVSAAAGPLAGDDLRLDISVGAGARLVVRSVAASVALPGRSDDPSLFAVSAEIEPGGALEFLPEPTVIARGARHRMTADVTLGAGGLLRYREEIVLGRFGEAGGAVETALRVDLAGSPPLLRQELQLGPHVPGAAGPAVLGGARAVGSLLVAGTPLGTAAAPALADGGVLLPLTGPGFLVSALADDAVTLRRRIDSLFRQAAGAQAAAHPAG